MLIISHRGNIFGPNSCIENHPESIHRALDLGFNVEVDIWYHDGKFVLGHDKPEFEIDLCWLHNLNGVWIHAKNIEALYRLLKDKNEVFFHQNDKVTLTSYGYIWHFPTTAEYTANSIAVLPELVDFLPEKCYGICTDYPLDVELALNL